MIDFNTNPFADTSKAAVDSLRDLSADALQGVEALTALNLQLGKTLLAEFAETSQAAMAARNPQDLIQIQTAALQSAPKKALAYGRQLQEIISTATARQQAAAKAQFDALQEKFLAGMSTALKNTPNSENALALVKSAVTAANNAYSGVEEASRKVTTAIATNVAKATDSAAAA